MKSPQTICCALALTSLFLTGCGAPKPPLPSGEHIPVNSAPLSHAVNRSRLADEPPSLDPFEKPAVAPVVVPLPDSLPPTATSESAPVVLQGTSEEERLSSSSDDQNTKE